MLDQDNNLQITGRIKEIIITSGGENVEPFPVEFAMKQACPLVSHAVLIGEGRKYVSLLLTLKVEKDNFTQMQTQKLSKESLDFVKQKLRLSNVESVDEAIKTKEVQEYI